MSDDVPAPEEKGSDVNPIRATHILMRHPGDSPDKMRYNICRDLAYCHTTIIKKMVHMSEKWEAFKEFAASQAITDQAMEKTFLSFLTFLELANDFEVENVKQALDRAGWFDFPFAQQIGIMALYGAAMMPATWVSRRELIATGSLESVMDQQALNLKGIAEQVEIMFAHLRERTVEQEKTCSSSGVEEGRQEADRT